VPPPLMKDEVMDLNHELRFADLDLGTLSSESDLWWIRSGDLDEVREKATLKDSFSERITSRCFGHSGISKV